MPLVGDMSVAQVLNPCYLLPKTLGEERVLQTPETSPISESCKLRLQLRRTESALPGR